MSLRQSQTRDGRADLATDAGLRASVYTLALCRLTQACTGRPRPPVLEALGGKQAAPCGRTFHFPATLHLCDLAARGGHR